MKKQSDFNRQIEKLENETAECVALAVGIAASIEKQDALRPRSGHCVVLHKAILNFDASAQFLIALFKSNP